MCLRFLLRVCVCEPGGCSYSVNLPVMSGTTTTLKIVNSEGNGNFSGSRSVV